MEVGTSVVLANRGQLVRMFGYFGHILADTLNRHDAVYEPLVDTDTDILFGATRGNEAFEYAIWTSPLFALMLEARKR